MIHQNICTLKTRNNNSFLILSYERTGSQYERTGSQVMVHIQCTIIALHIVEDRISLLWLATMMKEILFRFLATALSVYKQFIVIESRRAKDD